MSSILTTSLSLATVLAFGLSDHLGVWKVSTVRDCTRDPHSLALHLRILVGLAIPETVVAFAPSDHGGLSQYGYTIGSVQYWLGQKLQTSNYSIGSSSRACR